MIKSKSIKFKIIIGLMIFFLLMIITSLIFWGNQQDLLGMMDNSYLLPLSVCNSGNSILENINELHHTGWILVLDSKNQDKNELHHRISLLDLEIRESIESIIDIYPGGSSDIYAVESAYHQWYNYWKDKIFPFTEQNQVTAPGELYNLEHEKLNTVLTELKNTLNNTATTGRADFIKLKSTLQKILQKKLIIYYCTIFIFLVISFYLLLILFRRFDKISRVTEQIAAGNYSGEFDETYQGDLGSFCRNMNIMRNQIVRNQENCKQKAQEFALELENEQHNIEILQTEIGKKDEEIRGLFDSGIMGIALWDESGRFIKVNNSFLQITGYSRQDYELGDITLHKLTSDENFSSKAESLNKHQTAKTIVPFEIEYQRKDMTKINALAGLNFISESPLVGILYILDITRQKVIESELNEIHKKGDEKVTKRLVELEENMRLIVDSRNSLTFLLEDVNDSRNEIMRVNKQLDALNKELEAFSYSVSHDLKAPLRAIDGFSHAIEEDYYDKLDDEGKEFITLIRSNAQKMGILINDLLKFSRLGRKEINYVEVNTKDLVKDVYSDLYYLEKSRKINFIVKDMENVFADRTMLKQVFANLLSNALKFTRQEEQAEIELGCRVDATSEEIEFYISDNGVGFDMKYYNKLFGVFQRLHTDEVFEGTGVGLALIQRIINKHKGRIWAESKSGEGCTFYFTLPRQDKIIDSKITLQKIDD